MSKKIVFCTHIEDHIFDSYGGRKCVNSFKYFHPDIDFIVYDSKEIGRIFSENLWCDFLSHMSVIMKDCQKRTNADLIIHVDADSMFLGRCEEIFETDYDIAGVRNNCDSFNLDERSNRPGPIRDLPNHLYLNCGLISSNNKEFLNDWEQLNKDVIKEYGKITKLPLGEQSTYNIVAYSGKYKLKILDPMGGNLHYGCSANQLSRKPIQQSILDGWHVPDWTVNTWGSWQDIEYKDGGFYLYNKKIKVLHHSGGGTPGKSKKLCFDLFNAPTIKELQKITGCQEWK